MNPTVFEYCLKVEVVELVPRVSLRVFVACDPLEETVAFAREHDATFQSAPAMLDRMHEDVDAER